MGSKMAELIPHLRDLCFSKNGHRVPDGFAGGFVKLHAEDWRRAQAHWEQIVEQVLNTDAVDPEADGRRAMHQAVKAAADLLDSTDLKRRCPMCALSGQERTRS
jgi:hypothetical protein